MSRETFWLIERNVGDPPEWWTGDPGKDWTRDANRAARFSSNTAATATMLAVGSLSGYCRVTEHVFHALSPDRDEGLRAALEQIETIYIDRAKPPVTHDWCRLCKARNNAAGQPFDHWDECPIAILRAALASDGET